MKKLGIRELQRNVSQELLKDGNIKVTSHGDPIAVIVSYQDYKNKKESVEEKLEKYMGSIDNRLEAIEDDLNIKTNQETNGRSEHYGA